MVPPVFTRVCMLAIFKVALQSEAGTDCGKTGGVILGIRPCNTVSSAGETGVVDADSLLAPPPQVGGADASHC